MPSLDGIKTTPNQFHIALPNKNPGLPRIGLHVALWLALSLGHYELFAARPEPTLTQLWAQHYLDTTNNAIDSARHVAIDPLGDVIVSGYTDNDFNGQDIITIKYSGLNGSVIWQRRYELSLIHISE